MKAFEVWINGEKRCVAGVSGDDALLSVGVLWTRVASTLQVGGMEGDEHLRWLDQTQLALKVGDEVMFRLVETDVVDEPIQRHLSRTRAEKEAEVREHLGAARALLAFVDEAQFALYEEHLAQNHLVGAADVLGSMGDFVAVPARFWRKLADACHALTQYEDRDRYREKFHAAQADDASSTKENKE